MAWSDAAREAAAAARRAHGGKTSSAHLGRHGKTGRATIYSGAGAHTFRASGLKGAMARQRRFLAIKMGRR